MDQINNLQVGSAKHLPRLSSSSKVQSNNDDSDKAELSFEALVAKLHEMPEIRVEAVDKGKELLNEANYPEDKALRTLAQNLISQRIV